MAKAVSALFVLLAVSVALGFSQTVQNVFLVDHDRPNSKCVTAKKREKNPPIPLERLTRAVAAADCVSLLPLVIAAFCFVVETRTCKLAAFGPSTTRGLCRP